MKGKEKNLEIFSKFNTVLSEIHSEKYSIGLQIVEAMKGRIFLVPVILDDKGRDISRVEVEVERKVIIYLNRSKNADLAEYEANAYLSVPDDEKMIIEKNDDYDDAMDALAEALEDNAIIVVGSIEDLCEDNDLEALITLLSELDQMDVIISSYIEGTHDAKYFCDMATLAEKFSS